MMKQWTRFLCLLLVMMLFTGCVSPADQSETTAPGVSSGAALETEPSETIHKTAQQTEEALASIQNLGQSPDDNYRTWYELFVYSFCDSDSDGIGDLKGVISKLDYLQELGINGIWFMPIHPSTSYHKYNVDDYYAIDPEYGTMEDFEELMAQCQQRGIHVILDLVVNHTGKENAWFVQACDYLRSLPQGAEPDVEVCPYVNYYTFRREAGSNYHQVSGTDWYYEGMFSVDMPDLNLGNEAVRQEIRQIMAFWLDKGVAGFRLDAAKEFYSGNQSANVEVLNWIQTTATELKEDVYLVAEVWENFTTIAGYYESGITSIFNFAFGNSNGKIIDVLRNAGNETKVQSFATALEKADAAYSQGNPNYIDAPFLSNHDVGRIAGFCGYDQGKTKLAAAMNLFMSGSAFIYYGEEIGMVAGSSNDPSFRAPFLWNESRDDGTTQPPPECQLPETYPFGSLESQRGDDGSIYNYYRQAIAIRQAVPAISHGKTTCEAELNQGCVTAFRKDWDGEQCLVLMNISQESSTVDLESYDGWIVGASLTVDETPVDVGQGSLTMPGYAVVVLLPQG